MSKKIAVSPRGCRRRAGRFELRKPVLQRFAKDRDGATAIEFGLVALPFFALLFAIIETALVFWSTQVLETAVADASRKIYTGQFQGANSDPLLTTDQLAATFREEVCSRVVALFDCRSKVHVDVKSFGDNFPAEGLALPVTEGEFDTSGFGYESSGPSEIVVVRAAMEYRVFLTLINSALANLNNGNRLIMAGAAFRNEPFAP